MSLNKGVNTAPVTWKCFVYYWFKIPTAETLERRLSEIINELGLVLICSGLEGGWDDVDSFEQERYHVYVCLCPWEQAEKDPLSINSQQIDCWLWVTGPYAVEHRVEGSSFLFYQLFCPVFVVFVVYYPLCSYFLANLPFFFRRNHCPGVSSQ